MRVGVLGAGAIAQVAHLPLLARMRGVEVVAVSDRDEAIARTIADRFGIPRVSANAEDVYGDPSIDAVVVCTPTDRHEEHVRGALAAGKHVLCEKPLAPTAEAVERILATDGARERLMVAMHQRHRPDVRVLRSFASAGDLGHVYFLKAGWLNRARPLGRSWRERKATAGGGVFMDLGIQMLDLGLWILGYPGCRRVSAQLYRREGQEVEDAATVLLRLDEGHLMSVEATWALPSQKDRQFLHVLGAQGSGSLTPLAVWKEMTKGLVNVTPALPQGRENPFTVSYRHQLQAFVELVRGERAPDPVEEQLTLLRITEAVYRSAEQERELEL